MPSLGGWIAPADDYATLYTHDDFVESVVSPPTASQTRCLPGSARAEPGALVPRSKDLWRRDRSADVTPGSSTAPRELLRGVP
jgi:hypothetical protein